MSDERRGNVVRGGFGKRRTVREPDRRNPQPKVLNSNWLDPDTYDALSPKEKRDLWAKRQIERKYNRRRKKHGGRRDNPIASTLVGFGILGVLVAGMYAWQSRPMSLFSSPALTASGQQAVTASFHLCHVGGGTNCVVDGDTIWLEGLNIRIADIDAPETHDFDCPEEKALGDRATQRLQELVNSGPISLSSIDRDQDVYGRKLRLVYVNGKSVGDTHWWAKDWRDTTEVASGLGVNSRPMSRAP